MRQGIPVRVTDPAQRERTQTSARSLQARLRASDAPVGPGPLQSRNVKRSRAGSASREAGCWAAPGKLRIGGRPGILARTPEQSQRGKAEAIQCLGHDPARDAERRSRFAPRFFGSCHGSRAARAHAVGSASREAACCAAPGKRRIGVGGAGILAQTKPTREKQAEENSGIAEVCTLALCPLVLTTYGSIWKGKETP